MNKTCLIKIHAKKQPCHLRMCECLDFVRLSAVESGLVQDTCLITITDLSSIFHSLTFNLYFILLVSCLCKNGWNMHHLCKSWFQGSEDAFCVGDMGDVINKFKKWKELVPRVEPFYGEWSSLCLLEVAV